MDFAVRVLEQCPWLLQLPIDLEHLKIVLSCAYSIGRLDGATDMKESMDRIRAAVEAK